MLRSRHVALWYRRIQSTRGNAPIPTGIGSLRRPLSSTAHQFAMSVRPRDAKQDDDRARSVAGQDGDEIGAVSHVRAAPEANVPSLMTARPPTRPIWRPWAGSRLGRVGGRRVHLGRGVGGVIPRDDRRDPAASPRRLGPAVGGADHHLPPLAGWRRHLVHRAALPGHLGRRAVMGRSVPAVCASGGLVIRPVIRRSLWAPQLAVGAAVLLVVLVVVGLFLTAFETDRLFREVASAAADRRLIGELLASRPADDARRTAVGVGRARDCHGRVG